MLFAAGCAFLCFSERNEERIFFRIMDIARQLLLQVFLIILNAFFAMAEIAVVSLNPAKLRKLEEDGDAAAPRLIKLAEEPTAFLSTIQVGITLAGFLGSAFAADTFSELLVNWIYNDLAFTAMSVKTLHTLSVVLITIILSYFMLVFGELVPKRIAMQKPMQVARLTGGVVAAVSTIMRPVVWFLSFSTNVVLKILHMDSDEDEETVTEEEIRMMVDLGEENGAIDSAEGEWIDNVFEFGETTVREVMTHVSDLVTVSADEAPQEVLRIIRESGRSRIPVCGESIDDVVGVLSTRAFLLERCEDMYSLPDRVIRPAYFVPETMGASQLFREMQKRKTHMAVVIDEYGQTAGVVTMEDLLEEIFGKIYDESDPVEEQAIQRLDEKRWRVSGSAKLEELAEEMGIEFPDDVDYDTVNGFVLGQLSNIPRDGTVPDVEACGLRIHVENIEQRRVVHAVIEKIA